MLDAVEMIDGSNIIDTSEGLMLVIEPINGKIFNQNMEFVMDEIDEDTKLRRYQQADEYYDLVEKYDIKYFIYQFGEDYFYTKVGKSDLIPFRYIGEAFQQLNIESAFLGVHGKYEMMNGTREYSDWCKKAKFFGIKSLGIAEHGTLAGVLLFQIACDKEGIQPIIGCTVTVESKSGERYEVKLYVETEEGWVNLLSIHKKVAIENNGWVSEADLYKHTEGLTCVVTPNYYTTKNEYLSGLHNRFENTYLQITTNEYKSNAKDRELLVSTKRYLDSNWRNVFPPVVISDAYCLDYEDTHLRKRLNDSVKMNSAQTTNHYFRSNDEVYFELEELFSETDDRFKPLLKQGLANTLEIAKSCQFKVDLKSFHLPKYEMTKAEQKTYESNEDLFEDIVWAKGEELIDRGYDEDVIVDRLEMEIGVIKKGGFVDYFLILWDIINWCEKQNILTGTGRGSAGGSLVSYCMGIIKLNPLDYDLIFERFLNEGRLEAELPDIDSDFNSERRDEVVEYMKERYGEDFVCRVGTYTTLQARGVVKDLCRTIGASDAQTLNRITKYIDGDSWESIFEDAAKKMPLKGFVQQNSDVIVDARAAYGAIKSASQHACAFIVIPKENGRDIFQTIPMRKDSHGNLISEWEGGELAKAGYLKEDILSTKQMSKINDIFDLIKENHGIKLTWEDIPLDDKKVYEYFCMGHTSDVFHFGSDGLTGYLQQVLPSNIHDMIAAIALYRPGAMDMGSHNKYVKCKNGEEEPEYDFGLEEVTKDTYGLYVYQEQIMKACQVLGGFTLTEADGVRKAMGKKIKELMDSYKEKFLTGAAERGCPERDAQEIWSKMETFARYGFNKSHAAAYALIGYACNWLKVNYPMEFWTVAFSKGLPEQLPRYLSEIEKTGDIKVVPPNVNSSSYEFVPDFQKKEIIWAINKITQCGPSATQAILDERDANGKFFSMEEFYERVPKAIVKKPVMVNLILSGAFDDMCGVMDIEDRKEVLREYFELRGEELPKVYEDVSGELFWELSQLQLSKLGTISYISALMRTNSPIKEHKSKFLHAEDLYDRDRTDDGQFCMVAGIITEIKEREDRNKRIYGDITINSDNQDVLIRMFADTWSGETKGFEGWRDMLMESKGRVLFITGTVSDWKTNRNIQTSSGRNGSKSKMLIL